MNIGMVIPPLKLFFVLSDATKTIKDIIFEALALLDGLEIFKISIAYGHSGCLNCSDVHCCSTFLLKNHASFSDALIFPRNPYEIVPLSNVFYVWAHI